MKKERKKDIHVLYDIEDDYYIDFVSCSNNQKEFDYRQSAFYRRIVLGLKDLNSEVPLWFDSESDAIVTSESFEDYVDDQVNMIDHLINTLYIFVHDTYNYVISQDVMLGKIYDYLDAELFYDELGGSICGFSDLPNDVLGRYLKPWEADNHLQLGAIEISASLRDQYLETGDQQVLAEIVSTMLHEMVHELCYHRGYKDSGEHDRHTKMFGLVAQFHGLLCGCDEDGNYCHTRLAPELSEIWEGLELESTYGR